jgi:DNA-binding FadR family transcriptional regulator
VEAGSQPDRLYRRVADQMCAWIDQGLYAPGVRLPPERELAEAMGVSRPTIREAMIALEIMGVVEVRDRSGIYVLERSAPASLESAGQATCDDLSVGAFELLEARIFVEGAAAGLAAETATAEDIACLHQCIEGMSSSDPAVWEDADRRFHMRIAAMSNNSALAAAIEMLWDFRKKSPLAAQIMTRAQGGGLEARADEHGDIVQALIAHDPVKAREAMRTHLEQVREYLLDATETAEIDALRDRLHDHRQSVLRRTRRLAV